MKEPEMSRGELYMEKMRRSGSLTDENRAWHEEMARMFDHPYSLEQKKAQALRGKLERLKKSRSGDKESAARFAALIEKHGQSLTPEQMKILMESNHRAIMKEEFPPTLDTTSDPPEK